MDVSFSTEIRRVPADPGELVSAIPHALGIHPLDSIVVVSLDNEDSRRSDMTLRADLPPRAKYSELVKFLLLPLLHNGSVGGMLIVVGGTKANPVRALPHRRLISECKDQFAGRGLTVLHSLWAADTTVGSDWRSYDDTARAGRIPDSCGCAYACVCAAADMGRREDLAAILAPAPEHVLARRADLLKAVNLPVENGSAGLSGLEFVQTWVERAASGILPQSDEDIVELVTTLADHAVRDACLDLGRPRLDAAGEQLWKSLTRDTPPPERAEAATLLAFVAYARGDGVLASIAIERALEADPSHRLLGLIASARTIGLPSKKIRNAGRRAAALARCKLADTSEGSS